MSLPSRERGLKLIFNMCQLPLLKVAPFAGAWIEINSIVSVMFFVTVAPFAGAWIEIWGRIKELFYEDVAPFAGAWIEIGKEVNR